MINIAPNTQLLTDTSQFEVDFVIPRLGIDLPIGIDPFLLFKSRDNILANLHTSILKVFNKGIELVRERKLSEAQQLFDFPEVAEIGLGYSKKSKQGSGVGNFLSQLIIETLIDSPALQERGVKHIEEMQLVSVGIGADRISDIAANLLKQYLIEYTQKQCLLWNIPLISGVPLSHIFDFDTLTWYDGYFELPISPIDNSPILLVPRRIVRVLPWINYDDFFKMEFSTYLRAKRVKGRLATKNIAPAQIKKEEKEKVVSLNRTEIERIDRYVLAKEKAYEQAQPSLNYIDASKISIVAEELKEKLNQVKTGREDAGKYQRVVLEILNFLFNPELIDGELEVATVDGTERRDIIFTNDSDQSFWAYLRTEHSSIFIMFEVKNTDDINNFYLNQVATYLGDRLGRLGFIVTRRALEEAQQRKSFSIFNDSQPRKIILTLSDEDLCNMLDMKCQGNDPMRHVQKLYRTFRTKVQ
ncbi:MAG: hypothetical protein DCF19_01600 [Pseudanabaena frigida]|uniref:Uncharacterized protein n=1 Tax=Pseudanabaena frigida TaxID=945775 RepID=A0A2W4WH86_9CYAN|nr:MAG: hypothetical protein DCF19_01600 [Pseudanabaena frigida]